MSGGGRRLHARLAVGAVCLLCALYAGVSVEAQYVSVDDQDDLRRLAAEQSMNGLEEAYFATAMVDPAGLNKRGLCSLAKASTDVGMSLQDAFYAAGVLEKLSCGDAQALKVAKSVGNSKLDRLQMSTSITELLMAVSLVDALDPSTNQAGGVVELLTELYPDTGGVSAVKEHLEAPSSVAALGRAMLLVAELERKEASAAALVARLRQRLTADARKLVARARAGQPLAFSGDRSRLEAASLLLRGAAALGMVDSLPEAKLLVIVKALVAAKHVSSARGAFNLVGGLQAITAPIYLLTLETTELVRGSGALSITAHVTTPLGQAAPSGTTVRLVRPSPTDFAPVASAPGQYEALLAAPAEGETDVEVSLEAVVPGTGADAVTATLPVRVPYKLDAVQVKVFQASGKASGRPLSIQEGAALPKKFAIKDGEIVEFAFAKPDVEEVRAAVILTSPSGRQAFFRDARAASNSLVIAVSSAGVAQQIGPEPGVFEASLAVGGPRLAAGAARALGSVAVGHAPLSTGAAQPAPAPRVSDSFHLPKPEILHTHREPDPRPPALVSVLFAAAAVAPMGLFVLGAKAIGVNFKALPSGPGLLPTALFHGSVAAVLLLFFLYWLRMNVLSLVAPLAVLLAATFFSGHWALSRLADARLKDEGSGDAMRRKKE